MKDKTNLLHFVTTVLCRRKTAAALALLSTLGPQLSSVHAQGTTSFNYQGRLASGTNAANGIYDLRFAIYGSQSGGSTVGGSLTNSAIAVSNGYFNVALDFGSGIFNGSARWLEIGVRTNDAGDFTTLSPRQLVTPAPYSLFAANSGLLNGEAPSYYAPASGSPAYVAKTGDTMTGSLNLPANGLGVGGNQLVLSAGNVGIGTTSPQVMLHSASTGADNTIRAETLSSDKAAILDVAAPGGRGSLAFGGAAYLPWGGPSSLNLINAANGPLTFDHYLNGTPVERMRITSDGNVGIATANPQAPLHVKATGFTLALEGTANPTSVSPTQQAQIAFYPCGAARGRAGWIGYSVNRYPVSHTNSNLHIVNDGGSVYLVPEVAGSVLVYGRLYVTNTASVATLTIRGGADLAEPFDITDEAIEAGMVVTIDPAHAGRLCLSRKAYDRTVAGVVSGANGVQSGLIMKQEGSEADGTRAVALTGRVYCRADASGGAIEPGDLLTTSDIPGHAMKVTDHARAQGAIIGKAMGPLESGCGLVLVLVSLQ